MPETNIDEEVDTEGLTNAQKAAIVITSIGAENASEVYKRLGEEEVEKLTFEVSSLPYVEISKADAVLN